MSISFIAGPLSSVHKTAIFFYREAEVEGNPRTTGKVRVNFKFNGDYNKLQKLINSGSINGLLVVKNSLEGPMLNLNE